MGIVPGCGTMKILRPLRYCEFRQQTEDGPEACSVFASSELDGMAFCGYHRSLVERAMEDEGVEN